jgi:hypothetical protein
MGVIIKGGADMSAIARLGAVDVWFEGVCNRFDFCKACGV